MRFKARHPHIKYLISIFIVATATLLQFLLWPWINPAPFIFYYPAIILAALFGDGITAIILSAILGQVYFVENGHILKWSNDYLRLAAFLFGSLLVRKITNELSLSKQSSEQALRDLQTEKSIRERFVSTLAHDLQTPLTAAKLSLQMIQRKNEPEYTQASIAKVLIRLTVVDSDSVFKIRLKGTGVVRISDE